MEKKQILSVLYMHLERQHKFIVLQSGVLLRFKGLCLFISCFILIKFVLHAAKSQTTPHVYIQRWLFGFPISSHK